MFTTAVPVHGILNSNCHLVRSICIAQHWTIVGCIRRIHHHNIFTTYFIFLLYPPQPKHGILTQEATRTSWTHKGLAKRPRSRTYAVSTADTDLGFNVLHGMEKYAQSANSDLTA